MPGDGELPWYPGNGYFRRGAGPARALLSDMLE